MYDYSDDRGPYKIYNDEKHVDVDYYLPKEVIENVVNDLLKKKKI